MVQERPVRVERRLSAILAADVAGYSRLMHNDEEATHAKLTVLLTDAVGPAITKDPRAQTDQRPKSAKARCRGRLGTGFAASYVDLMLAPISIVGRTPAQGDLDVWSHARSGECNRHF